MIYPSVKLMCVGMHLTGGIGRTGYKEKKKKEGQGNKGKRELEQ